jgi:hypothetical protein
VGLGWVERWTSVAVALLVKRMEPPSEREFKAEVLGTWRK